MTQLELIAKAMQWSPPVFLFGGFAEDALLYSKAARPHTDIDLLVFLDELPLHLKQAAELGFNRFETRWQVTPRGPLATGCISNGLDLEFCVMERTADGRAFFDMPSPAGGCAATGSRKTPWLSRRTCWMQWRCALHPRCCSIRLASSWAKSSGCAPRMRPSKTNCANASSPTGQTQTWRRSQKNWRGNQAARLRELLILL